MNIRKYLKLDSDEKPLDRMVTDGGMCAIFRRIGCIGDSLSSGEFEALRADGTRTYHDMFEYSWGQYIARSTGSVVYNFSRGGMTAKEYMCSFAENSGFWGKELLCQAYIIALGVNDLLNAHMPTGTVSDVVLDDYTQNGDTFAGYYAGIIQRLKAMQPHARFFLMTMPKERHEDEPLKEEHARLLYELADMFDHAYVLDFYKYFPTYDEEMHRRFFMGGHLNAAGYILTARATESYIDYIIRHNPKDFDFVPFIGTDIEHVRPAGIDERADLSAYYESIKSISPRVKRIPAFDPTGEYAGIQAVTVDGVDLYGKKTKFFAYVGHPDGASEDTPGIVLVHGGGGHAFLPWVKMWVDRGYSVIAPDTVGHMPTEVNAGNTEASCAWSNSLFGIFEEDGYIAPPDNDDMINSCCKPVCDRWMTHAVAQCMLSYSALIQSGKSSSAKTGITGISWGGVAVSLAIGYDDRFAFAIPVYGSGYLDVSHAWMKDKFAHPQTRRYFLAQDRFDKVNMPVLWLCYNCDTCFSVNSNSKSYLDTVKNNNKTAIAIIDKMGHSHAYAWARKESASFADSIVSGKPMIRFTSLPNGTDCECGYTAQGKVKARLFYLTKELSYSLCDKNGMNTTHMDTEWKCAELECARGRVKGDLPKGTKGYYVELTDKNGITVTTPYIIKKRRKK